jgi:protein-disulfide isomerase
VNQNGDKPSIMIVDDEEMVITSIKAFLQLETDYDIQGFTDPEQAADFAAKNRVDVAVSDYLMPMIIRDYVVPGKVYLVSREFPLSGQYHPYAREAALYATAAGRVGKYQQAADALFKNQAAWAQTGKAWDVVAQVLTPAEQKRVQLLVKDPGVVAEVQREYDEGVAAGVNATPTVIVTQGAKRYPIPAQQLHYGFLKSLLDGMVK